MNKYEVPSFITNKEAVDNYKKWLDNAATRHYKRDYYLHKQNVSRSQYKEVIHKAVIDSEGLDYYTGKKLDWSKINTWNNADAKKIRGYKREFKNLPTVEHIFRENIEKNLEFAICGWAINDAKNDLTIEEFIELCNDVITYNSASN